TDIFGHGGARQTADELGIDFLGEIPLDPNIRSGADAGIPIVESDPDAPVARAFAEIAQTVAAKTSVQHFFATTAASKLESSSGAAPRIFSKRVEEPLALEG